MFRRTLPHWTAPGITVLIPLAAVYLANRKTEKKWLPVPIIAALSILSITIVVGIMQIQFGVFQIDSAEEYNRIGKNDPEWCWDLKIKTAKLEEFREAMK